MHNNLNKMIAQTVIMVCVAILFTAGNRATESAMKSKPLVEDISKGPIQASITIDPAEVRLDKDIILTLKVVSPSEIDVIIPSLEDRFKGFIQNGVIDHEPASHAGKTTLERQFLLTPVISDEYRIAPFPIVYADKGKNPPESKWFASKPIVLNMIPIIDGKADDDIKVSMGPVWIYPPFKTVVLYVLLGVMGIAAIFLAWKIFKKARRQIQLMRMSPRERALDELSELMAKDLVGKNMVKEFYLELTMIVRRYIERQHRIRAPEQTTEEFLSAVGQDPRFSGEVATKLRKFLTAADLVKFAADHPEPDDIARATDTARTYVETDSADQNTERRK